MASTPTEEYKKWNGRVELAKVWRNKIANPDNTWDTFVKAVAGDFNTKQELGPEGIDVNYIHGTLETALPPLYTSEPYVTVQPQVARIEVGGQSIDNIERGRYTEAEVNYWLQELEVRTGVIKPCVIDLETTNHAYAYVGFIEDEPQKGAPSDENPELENRPLVRPMQPFCIRLSPKQVIVPHGTRNNLEDAPWLAIGWVLPVQKVRDRYGDQEVEGMQSLRSDLKDMPAAKDSSVIRDYIDSNDLELVQIWQIWDKEEKKLYTIAEGHDRFLDKGDWPYEVEGFPVVHASSNLVPDEYWGSPPMSFYYPQQKELNAARTAARIRSNRTKSTVFVEKDLAEEIQTAYSRGKDGAVIPVEVGDEGDIRRKVMHDPGLPEHAQAYGYGAIQQQDLLFITGLGTRAGGSGDPNVDTATESANTEKWALVRATNRGDIIRSLYLGITKKLWMVLKQFPDVVRDRLVVGPGKEGYSRLVYSLAELEGQFSFTFDLGTLIADNPQARQQQALANYNLFRADPMADPTQLLLDVFRSQGKRNVEAYLAKLRGPDEELELWLQGLPTEADEADDHAHHQEAHSTQIKALEQQLDQVDPESQDGEKIRMAMMLGLTHLNHHGKILIEQQGEQGLGAVNPNMARSTIAQAGGAETAAELSGQPQTSEATPPGAVPAGPPAGGI